MDARSPDEPWTAERCCGTAKVDALERALTGVDAWITGIRREQAPTRAAAAKLERDERRGIWKVNPLADWTEKDLWHYIFEHDLPYHPLHDQGYASIGCAPCTQPGAGREGRWAGQDKTECGLHVEQPMNPFTYELSHLETLEAESIHIFREVAAEFERPVLLFSGGKDSIVLLRLAEKAFRPGASRSRSCTSTPATTSPR